MLPLSNDFSFAQVAIRNSDAGTGGGTVRPTQLTTRKSTEATRKILVVQVQCFVNQRSPFSK